MSKKSLVQQDMGGNRIENVGDPVAAQDVATRAYVLANAGGGGDLPVTVLQWDHDTPQSVNHGEMWPQGVDLGPFWWECWCAPTSAADYWITEGHGGAHAILAGFADLALTGNVWTGSETVSFGGGYLAQENEWLHYTVAWDGTIIWVLINGIVVSKTPFTGPRRAQYGTLMIGGSDHSNFDGKIAQIRGWEGQFPINNPWAPVLYNNLSDRHFSDRFLGWPSAEGSIPCQIAASYINAADSFPDMGSGYGGALHPGKTYTGNGVGSDLNAPHPIRVVDPTAPFGPQYNVARTRTFPAPDSVPVGAKIFDSFSRADVIPAFNPYSFASALPGTRMGNTEGGSLGAMAWQHADNYFGIFDGSAVGLGYYQYARVPNNSADMDIRSGRRPPPGVAHDPAVAYGSVAGRITADRASGWSAVTSPDYLGVIDIWVRRPDGTVAATWRPPTTTWTHLRMTFSGTTITVFVSDGTVDGNGRPAGWTQLGQLTGETQNQAEVGAGIYHYYGTGSAARYTDFEVR